MRITKKILSLALVLVMCLTSQSFVLAADEVVFTETSQTQEPAVPEENLPQEDITSDGEDSVTDEETEVPQEKEPLKNSDVVANFYVFLDESDVHPMGHTWIYAENITDQEITVGLYTVQPGEGVSVGLFKRKDGWTIYYNIEAYSQTVYGMEGQISLKEELTLSELRRVSNAIIYYPNHWDPIFNCMFFSFIVWDTASFKILLPLLFPVIGKLQMLIYPHETDVQMKPVTKEQTFRQTGMAWFASLVPTTDKVLGPV